MRDLSQSARVDECEAAEASRGVHPLSGVPQRRSDVRHAQQRRGPAIFQTQPVGPAIPEMHHVSRGDTWVQRRSVFPEVTAMLKTLLLTMAAAAAMQAQ